MVYSPVPGDRKKNASDTINESKIKRTIFTLCRQVNFCHQGLLKMNLYSNLSIYPFKLELATVVISIFFCHGASECKRCESTWRLAYFHIRLDSKCVGISFRVLDAYLKHLKFFFQNLCFISEEKRCSQLFRAMVWRGSGGTFCSPTWSNRVSVRSLCLHVHVWVGNEPNVSQSRQLNLSWGCLYSWTLAPEGIPSMRIWGVTGFLTSNSFLITTPNALRGWRE